MVCGSKLGRVWFGPLPQEEHACALIKGGVPLIKAWLIYDQAFILVLVFSFFNPAVVTNVNRLLCQ